MLADRMLMIQAVDPLLDLSANAKIGDYTLNGGLAAGFDGVTNHNEAQCAKKGSAGNGYIGVDLGVSSGLTIKKMVVYPAADNGYTGGTLLELLEFRSDPSDPGLSYASTGTIEFTHSPLNDPDNTNPITALGLNITNRFIWMHFRPGPANNTMFISELQLWIA